MCLCKLLYRAVLWYRCTRRCNVQLLCRDFRYRGGHTIGRFVLPYLWYLRNSVLVSKWLAVRPCWACTFCVHFNTAADYFVRQLYVSIFYPQIASTFDDNGSSRLLSYAVRCRYSPFELYGTFMGVMASLMALPQMFFGTSLHDGLHIF